MRVLYIKSGYRGIYQYLDDSIMAALQENGYAWEAIHPKEEMDVVQRTVSSLQPTCMIALLGDFLSPTTLQYLKSQGIKTVCWLTEDPFYMDKTVRKIAAFDYICSVDLGACKYYQSMHKQVHHVPLGTNPAVFHPIDSNKSNSLLLLGFPYPSRVRFTEFLMEKSNFPLTIVGRGWNDHMKTWQHDPRLTIKNQWLPPQEVMKCYNEAQIVLNPHRQYNCIHNQNRLGVISESINNRTFDIAACRAFTLTEAKMDLASFFTVNEMVSYYNEQDCLEKIEMFMREPAKCETMALGAYKRTIQEHTFRHRLAQIHNIVM
ncbi:CgeB family protein [Ectobacillus antri]|uniref:CgeB family protein n=1 Tax=Ectobacillus antri TaxID=2486280 RepID=UPI000F5ABD2E|nr:glycosyltransferase [Ectobacillus antri]